MTNRNRRLGISKPAVVILLMILVGISLGPVQMAYCHFWSGKPVGEYPFSPGKEIVISLSPEMNPVAFNAKIIHEKPSFTVGRKSTQYRGELSLDGKEVWTNKFGVSENHRDDKQRRNAIIRIGSNTSNTTVSIVAFDVTEAGDYKFVAERVQNDLRVEESAISVRRNVTPVHMLSAIAGFAMLVFGGVVGALLLFRSVGKQSKA